MELELNRSPRMKRRKRPIFGLILLLVLLVASLALGFWYMSKQPSTEHVKPFEGRTNIIVHQGQVYPDSYLTSNDQILLPFDFIKEKIDPTIFWDEASQSVIVTTKDKVLRMENDKLVAYLNKTPVNLRVPVQVIEGKKYVPYLPLESLYPFQMKHVSSTQIVTVEKNGDAIQQGKLAQLPDQSEQPIYLRTGADKKHPVVADLQSGTTVDILKEEGGWYYVQTADGLMGYLPKELVKLSDLRKVTVQTPEEKVNAPWKPLGEKISLVWEHVVSKNPNVAEIPVIQGLHVVSPTWFELVDNQATLGNKADAGYVKWAHSRGYQVWGLVSNGFNPDFTHALLSDFHMRDKFIRQVVQYANMYNLDGINLDFENVYLKDKELLVQLVRELTPYLHEQKLTVSMDVTIKSDSDRWSKFYDRAALASIVDYMAVMTYDEHWASSPVAGSVASLPWTEAGVKALLSEIPKKKLLLGVPFYTRLWKEQKQADGTIKVSSKAYSMPKIESWLAERNIKPVYDAKSGQNFASYTDPADGATYKVWLEDESSIQKRIQLVHQYDLAGIAAWRRGFEKPEVWGTIKEHLH